MVLTCTLGASLIVGIDRDTLRTTLIAALGCNVAWGVIDAALYIMGNAFVRSRNSRLMQAIRSAPDAAAGPRPSEASHRTAHRIAWPR